MPRDGSGHFQVPVGTDGVTDQTIDSGRYNGFVHDVETDLNTPRPISAGGTGANNAADAMTNLGGEIANQQVTNYDTFPFKPGSFSSAGSATASPVPGHAFIGICYVYALDPTYMTIEARDLNDPDVPGLLYIREKAGGVWSGWVNDDLRANNLAATKVSKVGDIMSGNLTIRSNSPAALLLDSTGPTYQTSIVGFKASLARWQIMLGDGTTETGTEAGSNLVVNRFADNGDFLDAPVQINRADARLHLLYPPTAIDHATRKDYVDAQAALRVAKSGDTMSGALTVNSTITVSGAVIGGTAPSVASHLTRKDYVDAADTANATLAGGKVTKAGDTMTGPLAINSNLDVSTTISAGSFLVCKSTVYCDAVAAGNATLQLRNEVGTNKGSLFWDRASDTLQLLYPSAPNQIILFATGRVRLASGQYGKRGHTSGVYDTNSHNFYWSGSATEMWIDDANFGTINVTCDYRTKKDVVPLASTWAVVKELKPVVYTQAEFTPPANLALQAKEAAAARAADPRATVEMPPPLFVADDIPRWGFLAHELQETLLPSAAHGYKDSPTDIQTPNTLCLTAALTRALQEAMARIEALESRAGATYATSR